MRLTFMPSLTAFAAFTATWAVLTSCSTTAAPGAPTAATLPASGVTSFKSNVAPLLTSKCVSCHTPAGRGARDMVFQDAAGQTDYAQTKAGIDRIISSVESGKMPQGGPALTTAEIGTLVAWQKDGMPNN
jgi:mono/diheme cytochrome c family protein